MTFYNKGKISVTIGIRFSVSLHSTVCIYRLYNTFNYIARLACIFLYGPFSHA